MLFPVPTLAETYASIPKAYCRIVSSAAYYDLLWARQEELVQTELGFLGWDWEAL